MALLRENRTLIRIAYRLTCRSNSASARSLSALSMPSVSMSRRFVTSASFLFTIPGMNASGSKAPLRVRDDQSPGETVVVTEPVLSSACSEDSGAGVEGPRYQPQPPRPPLPAVL